MLLESSADCSSCMMAMDWSGGGSWSLCLPHGFSSVERRLCRPHRWSLYRLYCVGPTTEP